MSTLELYRPIREKGRFAVYTIPYDQLPAKYQQALASEGRFLTDAVYPEHRNTCEVCGEAATSTGLLGIPDRAFEDYQPEFVGRLYVYTLCDKHKDISLKDLKTTMFGRRHPMSVDFQAYLAKRRKEGTAMGGERASQVCLLCGGENDKCAIQQAILKNGTKMIFVFGLCSECDKAPNRDELILSQMSFAYKMRGNNSARLLIIDGDDSSPEELARLVVAPFSESLLWDEEAA